MIVLNYFLCHRFENAKNTLECGVKSQLRLNHYDCFEIKMFSNTEVNKISLQNIFRTENITINDVVELLKMTS